MSNPYVWKKLTDRQEFPEGLQDLITDAYILVYNGIEYAGIFIHGEVRCWLGWRGFPHGETRNRIFRNPDEARRHAEVMMKEGLLLPRRRSRF